MLFTDEQRITGNVVSVAGRPAAVSFVVLEAARTYFYKYTNFFTFVAQILIVDGRHVIVNWRTVKIYRGPRLIRGIYTNAVVGWDTSVNGMGRLKWWFSLTIIWTTNGVVELRLT